MLRTITRIGDGFKRNSRQWTGSQVRSIVTILDRRNNYASIESRRSSSLIRRRFYDAEKISGVTGEEPMQQDQETWVTRECPDRALPNVPKNPAAHYKLESLLIVFADLERLQWWCYIKQLFELWISYSFNKPDLDLFNHYIKANVMMNVTPSELLDIIEILEDKYGIKRNLTSLNLVLKAMNRFGEVEMAVKLFNGIIEAKKFLPDQESYALVISMLLRVDERNVMIDPLIKIYIYLNTGHLMSQDLFVECVRYFARRRRAHALNFIIQSCKNVDQDLKPNWFTSCHILHIALKNHNSRLANSSLEFILKFMTKKNEIHLHDFVKEQVQKFLDGEQLIFVLELAGKTYSEKLVARAWYLLKRLLDETKIPSKYYIAKIKAYASIGNLQKAFATLREFESLYGGTTQQADADLFSPFSNLKPLVLACSQNGCGTLDHVYYQLEALSKADPPYKSVVALNCIILGCANIRDDIRAEETFKAISTEFGLSPDINSYNGLISAFGKLKRREEALELFKEFEGLGIEPNKWTFEVLVDAHVIARDPKSALSIIDEMVIAGYEPTKEILKKVRWLCVCKMDTESDDQVEALANKFKIKM